MNVRAYYRLTKPGIIYGNLLTTTSGFLLACHFHIHYALLLATLLGVALVIASACVINNYIDRDIDAVMSRTKERALVTGAISETAATFFGVGLGAVGFCVLFLSVNMLTALLGIIAFLDYVILYGIYKRRSVHGTLIGSIAGAIPPVAGYTAVTNRLDSGAIILFLIMVCWQMPHFYSIAIYRLKDYKSASIPVLPVKKGITTTKLYILWYIGAFAISAPLLSVFGYTGYIYLVLSAALGLLWLSKGITTPSSDPTKWAKSMFLFSLIVICAISVLIPLGAVLP